MKKLDFKRGDLVKHKVRRNQHLKPLMTVTSIEDENTLSCKWYDVSEGGYQTRQFDKDDLILVRSNDLSG